MYVCVYVHVVQNMAKYLCDYALESKQKYSTDKYFQEITTEKWLYNYPFFPIQMHHGIYDIFAHRVFKLWIAI